MPKTELFATVGVVEHGRVGTVALHASACIRIIINEGDECVDISHVSSDCVILMY